ncbi:MAG TPA: Ig-like domain repeat protein [Terriglobales bacterium]|nr:Ig-like domain repeat protein [Terriglobales bacterium]
MSIRRFGPVAVFFCLVSSLSFAQQVSRVPLIAQPVLESDLTTLRGNTHPLARPQFDTGVAPPDLPMNRMLLVLKRSPEQEHALMTTLDNQHDKLSPQFHHWLTPDEFGAEFGPSNQDLQTVTGWLQSHAFQINRVSHGRSVIEFSGVEAQVEEAFHTAIHKYSIDGEEHWANVSDPQIPTALVPAVAGIWSLHNFLKKPNVRISPEKLTVKYTAGKQPDTTFPDGNHALSPADYATIYNISPVYSSGNLGGGKIAVVARSDLFGGGVDVSDFWSDFGVPGGILRVINDGPDPGDLGGEDEAEATLDASWSGAIAPSATINFVVSATTNTTDGVDLSELYIIDNNLAPIMTESFGSCDTFATQAEAVADSQLAEQAAAQGITYMVSSGDSGAAGCDPANAAPAILGAGVNVLGTPFNVVVGGTQFTEGGNNAKYWSSSNNQSLGSALSYIPEDVWNESCLSCSNPEIFSTGGGVSKYFTPKPTWQAGVSGIPNDNARDQPDLALNAAVEHDPYIICLEGSCTPVNGEIFLSLIGGTSASTPAFAAIMNLVDQQYGAQGQANYELYSMAAQETLSQCNGSSGTTLPASTCIFNDVTSGNNSVPGQNGFSAGTGYDQATGLGSVNVNNLVTKWNSASFRATTTTLGSTPSPITGTHGLGITINVSVAPNVGSGTPTGDVSLLTSNNQSAGFLTLSAGAKSATVNDLPGGSYTLTAKYGGDTTFAPSPLSNTLNVNITPESSSTNLSLLTLNPAKTALVPFTGGPYGSLVYIRADVAGTSGVGVPIGSVDFMDGSSSLGGLNLNAQGNTATPNAYFNFTTGSHSVLAHYRGDQSFNISESAPATFSITPATTLSLLSPVSGVVQGQPATLTMNIASTAFAGYLSGLCIGGLTCESFAIFPTGTVTFFDNGTQIGTPQTLSGGQFTTDAATGGIIGVNVTGSLATSALTSGSNSITAQYSGDSNYSGSTAPAINVGTEPDFAFAAANSSVNVSSPGGSVTNSLTITGQTGYSGTINFTGASCAGLPALTSCSFNPASVAGNGSTTVTIKTTAPTSAALHPVRWTGMGFVFAGIFLIGVPRRRFLVAGGTSVLLICLGLGSVGCGGGNNGGGGGGGGAPGTPPGSYTVTVTATTSDNVVSHQASFTLVVQ